MLTPEEQVLVENAIIARQLTWEQLADGLTQGATVAQIVQAHRRRLPLTRSEALPLVRGDDR